MGFIDRRFALAAHGTTVRTEVLAGVTTFLTMAYIVFVQPAVRSPPVYREWRRRRRRRTDGAREPRHRGAVCAVLFGYSLVKMIVLLKVASGRRHEVHGILHLFAALFLVQMKML